MSKHSAFCPLPWIHQDINNNGEIRLCCPSSVSKGRGVLKKEDGSIYNSAVDDLESARNSPTLKKIRSEMLKGRSPSACIRCRQEEAAGVQSRRLQKAECWKNIISFEKAGKLTDKDGSINPSEIPVVDYDLRLGNHCNLKCRMCGPSSSDSWYSDFVKISNSNIFQDHDTKIRLVKNKNNVWQAEGAHYDWFLSPMFWESIKKTASEIRQVHIVGGEPLLIDRHWDILKIIIKYGSPEDTVIEYNSNLTFLPKKVYELWKPFKKIQIGASIDGYGAVNNYIRYPSRFEKIEKNLEVLDKSFDNIQIWISTTVSVYNIFHLPELIEWKLKKRFLKVNYEKTSHNPLITAHLLHVPSFLNIKALPKSYKDQVKTKFGLFLRDFPDFLEEVGVSSEESVRLNFSAQKLLGGYVNYMNLGDLSHLIPVFRRYTESLDKIRNEKLQDILPELWENLRPYETLPQELSTKGPLQMKTSSKESVLKKS